MGEPGAFVTVRRRNVVVVGKFGAGKSTVCNNITESNEFTVSSGLDGVTKAITHKEVQFPDSENSVHYIFKVVDTVGLFNPETERTSDAKKDNKRVLMEAIAYLHEHSHEGVSVILFVCKEGRYTGEMADTFQSVFEHLGQEMSEISALVITGCEHFGVQERKDLVEEFKSDERTSHIARFMGKGIYPVGFPDTTNMKETLRDAYKNGIEHDRKTLRHLIMDSERMKPPKDLFRQTAFRCSTL